MSEAIPMDSTPAQASGAVDEGLYSRQLYVFGHEAQRRMAMSDVLLVGLNGLGVELAKNVILAGVKSVTLHDDTLVTWEDLSAQFYLSETDIGRRRDLCTAPKLAELNPYVGVSVQDGELTQELVSNYQVVVLIDAALEKQFSINDYCHANNICFISAEVRGVFGSIFCDFGESFTVSDATGEPAAQSMVASITKDVNGLVTVLEDTRHNLETGDVVTLNGIVGMDQLNGQQFRIAVKDSWSFEIDADTTTFGDYVRGGYITQIKQPTQVSFKSLRQAIVDPGMFVCDFMKFDNIGPLHVYFRALHQFRATHNQFPEPGNSTHADEVFSYALTINSSSPDNAFKVDELERFEELIKKLTLGSRCVINPMCAIIGGIAGQEVLKACSGKFMPIVQFFHFDCVEALPEEPLSADEIQPVGNRYDAYVQLFGQTLQRLLFEQRIFLIGAGAIGCELLKNFAMMGIACGSTGAVTVTDMDRIERSNLSRQFLFRTSDIHAPKSTTAARAAQNMNPEFRVLPYELKVASETENVFGDDFFESLTCVCTALDNVEARLYVDQRCVFYHVPMIDSGTLGTKANTQVVLPHFTEHYGATRDPPEKGIPICTLKHFPNQIEHTIQWAREWFEENFKQTCDDVNKYLSSTKPEFMASLANQQNMKMEVLKRVREALVNRPNRFEDCVTWARLVFEELFANGPKQLLHNFPLDKLTTSGTPFWSGAKKPPTPLRFDVVDPVHMEFIVSVARIRAIIYGLPLLSEDAEMAAATSHVSHVIVPEFRPQDGMKIPTAEEEKAGQATQAYSSLDIDAQCGKMLDELPESRTFGGFTMAALEFDKDVDEQMVCVCACSNLRAMNYNIPVADMHTSRGIAGKIIPAIATTTALACGLVCIELIKVVQQKKLEKFRSSFMNLAIPVFTSSEPTAPAVTVSVVKGQEWKWSIWDRVDVNSPDMTLQGLVSYMASEYGVELSMLSHGVSILYSSFMNPKKLKERKNLRLTDVVETVTKKAIPADQKYLIFEIIVSDIETEKEVEFPYLRFKLH